MSNLIGQSLGRYHLLEQLGEGGMATVYKAFDTRLETDVAVKVIRTENLAPSVLERALKRFEREAKSLARLTHPNIVKVTDYGEYEGKPYLVMPYLPGGTLKERLGKPIPWQETARLLIPIAEALDFAHSQNMIHRDVKPSNILLTQRGQPMLTDFGIAKILDLKETQDLTGTGMGIGTPEYMAPEQWTGKTTSLSDQYSLGVVLYEMLTGRKPYTADTPAAILLKQATEPLPRPSQYARGLPEKVEKLLLKALAKNPADRYPNMGDFAIALESVLGGVAAPARPQPEHLRERTLETQAAIDQMTGETVQEPSATPNARPIQTITHKESPSWLRFWPIGLAGILVLGALSIYTIVEYIIPPQATAAAPVVFKVGQVTDLGGIDDKSFNASAWKGAEQAMTDFGIQAKYLESQQQSDYARNIQQYLNEGTDVIITVGFLLGVDTARFAIANPDQKFAIVDYTYPDCWPGANVRVDCGTAQDLANVRGLAFQTDQAAFMAGYLAAGMTKTGKVATYGGLPIPTVTIFMKGFEAGVKYYNQQKGTAVEVLGWNNATGEGTFSNNFESTDDGRQLATSFMEEGADIILPVAGQVGLGTAAVCKETGRCKVIGVDADWVETAPEYQDVILTSVLKRIDVAVYNTIKELLEGSFTGGTVTYTIADGGVDIAPFHEFDSAVSAELKAELEAIKAALIDGSLTVDGVLSR